VPVPNCLHIAYAVVNDCDVVLSWNFDDIVCDKTRNRVKLVNATSRYKEIWNMEYGLKHCAQAMFGRSACSVRLP